MLRLQFQDRPWDLYLSILYTILVASSMLVLGVGNLFGILLVLFVPGYVLVATLFPGKDQVDWMERLLLSFGLSIAVVPLLGLGLNFTSFGLRPAAVVVTIAVFTSMLSGAAWWRRMHMEPERRLSASLEISFPMWNDFSTLDRTLTLVLVASIVVAAFTVAVVLTASRPSQHFTEFYILGPAGNASGYPTLLNASQPGSVIYGIVNHESVVVNYTVRIDLVGIRVLYNASTGMNEIAEINRTSWYWTNVTLANGQSSTRPFMFWINTTALWKVQFLLFKEGNQLSPYRELHIYVRVA